MSKGSKEIDRMFNKLNRLIDESKDLKKRVKRKWEGEFHTSFVSYDIPKFLEEIEFFQNKYNFDKKLKIDTEGVLRSISEKYQIKERTKERTEEPALWERALYLISEEKGSEPETKKYIVTENYGKFISDPQEDFTDLFEGLINIYNHCFQKYFHSELDIAEIKLGKFLKWRFLKNWKSILLSIFIGIILITSFLFLTSWISTLF